MFDVGDKVVHPMHGAGMIECIATERVEGNDVEFYVFRMPVSGLLLKIPVGNSNSIGIRQVADPEEIAQVLTAIPELPADTAGNWNHRYRENLLRLKSGNIYEVAGVIKSLLRRDGERGLSNGERKMLHSAKQILLSEMALSTENSYEMEEARLNEAVLGG